MFSILCAALLLCPQSAVSSNGISWHPGPPRVALEEARQAHKPAFVFWGASWCPPCNHIKATVFTDPAFIRQIRQFVAVAVDGDADGAQAWAESVGVSAYPTLLIFSASGREEYRIEGDRPAVEVVSLLAEAADAPADGAIPTEDDGTEGRWRALASGAWRAASDDSESPQNQVDRLYGLQRRCPARLARERSKLFIAWLSLRGAGGSPLSRSLRTEAEQRLRDILRSDPLVAANLASLTSESRVLLDLVAPDRDSRRSKLGKTWLRAMARAEADKSLPLRDRLSALLPAIQFSRSPGDRSPLQDSQRAHIRSQVQAAVQAATTGPLKQSIFSMAGSVFRQAGMKTDAVQLYTRAIAEAPEPYQFMLSLATLAKEAGRTDEATDWLERAYDAAQGQATRFQWGVEYVSGLIDLTPNESERIEGVLATVLEEIAAAADAARGRNAKRLAELKLAVDRWSAARDPGADAVADVLRRLGVRCRSLEAADQRARCEALVHDLHPR